MNRRRTDRSPARRALIALVTASVAVGAAVVVLAVPLAQATVARPGASWSGGGELGENAGVAGGSAFDDRDPAVSGLRPELRDALERAAAAAREDDVQVQLTSGWRSPEEQQRLLDDAVEEYGSRAEAARWVATPETSAHVSGEAADVGEFAAVIWIGEHGHRFGLCRVYENEPWHVEYRPEAPVDGCPPVYRDPTEDPRMQG